MFSLTNALPSSKNARYCYFEDGRKATGDVLVAADGTHSMTRSYVLGHAVERRYVGYNWNGLVPASDDLAPKNSWNVYVGEHKRASMMPVGAIALLFFDVPLAHREQTRLSGRTG